MTDTVQIALIAAASGLVGAVVGAVAAVVGPWLLSRSERKASQQAAFVELRRAAIIEFFDADTRLTVGVGFPDYNDRVARANAAFTSLGSLLQLGEGSIDVWLRWLRAHSQTMPLQERMAYQSWGEKMLFEWHRGERKTEDVKRFELVVVNGNITNVQELPNPSIS